MAILTLLDGVSATGAGTAVDVGSKSNRVHPEGWAQFAVGTGTVALEGSVDKTTWISLSSKTANGGADVAFVPRYVRGNCTAHTSGTHTLKIEVL